MRKEKLRPQTTAARRTWRRRTAADNASVEERWPVFNQERRRLYHGICWIEGGDGRWSSTDDGRGTPVDEDRRQRKKMTEEWW
ncbi:unnamed protein product [Lactuca virosa]|uniref:Uncharacterized protein n=1 Tax=Lactuca virosa TaxID=75947 RepID=A0AAU9NRG7_9ASTR|nr:unnamed protein product [Lactuca virosa]